MRSTCACSAPRQRIIAQLSRWREMKCREASASATPASTTAVSAASPRKCSARSSAVRISGRASRTSSIFSPTDSRPCNQRTQISHLLRIARHHQAVTDAAAFLHQSAGGQICRIHDHARRKTGEADRLVHETHHPRRHPQMQLADAHLVAQLQTQALHQALIRPQRAACGDGAVFVPDDMLRAIIDDRSCRAADSLAPPT